jgi:hypothetical protein
MRARFSVIFAATTLLTSSAAFAQSVPLDDPRRNAPPYLGLYNVGLYNDDIEMPAAHHAEGLRRGNAILPLDHNGNPDAVNGKIVVMSMGMSNAAGEWCNLDGLIPINVNPDGSIPCYGWTGMGRMHNAGWVNLKHPNLQMLHSAFPAQIAFTWKDDNAGPLISNPPNPAVAPFHGNYTRVRDYVMPYYTPTITENQVQVIWVKQQNPAPTVSLPENMADARVLQRFLGQMLRFAKQRYPNLSMVFFTSAAYRGYGINGFGDEPYGYETGLTMKWLYDAQINQVANGGTVTDRDAGDLDYTTDAAPWVASGPYWWADGTISREADGIAWQANEYLSFDYVHLDLSGNSKIGLILAHFFTFSPYTHCWFTGDGPCQ